MHPHNITFPPPNFTVGIILSSSLSFCQLYLIPSLVIRLILVSLDQITFIPSSTVYSLSLDANWQRWLFYFLSYLQTRFVQEISYYIDGYTNSTWLSQNGCRLFGCFYAPMRYYTDNISLCPGEILSLPGIVGIYERLTDITDSGFGILNLICGFTVRCSSLEKFYDSLSSASAQHLYYDIFIVSRKLSITCQT